MKILKFGPIAHVFLMGVCCSALLACGGSGGGAASTSSSATSVASSSSQPAVVALTATIVGLPEGSELSVVINGANPLAILPMVQSP